MHSLNFSDGLNTVDEIVQFAGKLGYKKIMITDHASTGKRSSLSLRGILLKHWKNVHNNVEVEFGVEADLLNAKGDISSAIQEVDEGKIIISPHLGYFEDDLSQLETAFEKAIERFHERIFCIGHLHIGSTFWAPSIPESFDVVRVIQKANEYKIPLELNGTYIEGDLCNCKIAELIIEHADTIVINSDAHTLAQLRDNKQKVKKFILNYIKGKDIVYPKE